MFEPLIVSLRDRDTGVDTHDQADQASYSEHDAIDGTHVVLSNADLYYATRLGLLMNIARSFASVSAASRPALIP